MSHGIKLVRLSVQDVGVLAGRFDLGPFSDGINVISGRNEAGKSTLVEALRAALFERHDGRNQKLRALQTRGTRNPPEVWVELDIGGERVSVHKRFLEDRLAEVRLHNEGTVVVGAEAEDLLLARLEGRRPGKRGGSRNDMGLWGLLWVAQDETAYTDPGDTLDEEVRGALSEAIGRQVGRVLGGKHGERVRTRVLEHAARYFTLNSGSPTGELRAAEERLKAASARVRQCEAAWASVRSLAEEHNALSEQLRAAELELPRLERELDDAVAAEQRVQELEGRAREAELRVAEAKAVVDAVQRDVEARVSLVREAAELEAEIQRCDGHARELEQRLDHARRKAAAARGAAEQARSAATAARTSLDAAMDELVRARRREAVARVAGELRAAEAVATQIAEIARRLEAETIDERALQQLEELAAKTAALRSRLDAEGTRIVVFPAEGDAIVYSFGAPARIDVPGLGVLEVDPARPGLAQAVADAERRRTKLEEALLALGVANVAEARARYAARAEAEHEHQELSAQKKQLAPKGLDALEEVVRERHEERARLESALDEAARAEQEREASLRHLAVNRVDEAVMDGLRQREQEISVLRAACDASGTLVEVRAITDLGLRVGGAEISHLSAGEGTTFTSTVCTTVILDKIAEIKLEPRGKDLTKSLAKLERAERELADMLQAHGVASVADAAEAARAWVQLDGIRKRAEARLAELAPRGLEALRDEVEKVRACSVAAETALAHAKRAFARHAQLEVELAQNPVTGEALARLERLERELGDAQAAIERLQARVRAISGPVAAGLDREWAVPRALRPDGGQDLAWEIIPGELGPEIDIDGLERRFREALARAGVSDLDAARARFWARTPLEEQLHDLRKRLKELAPEGLEALRARAAALACAEEAVRSATARGEASGDLAALQTAVDERREQERALAASAERAAEVVEAAERELQGLERSFGEAAAVRCEKAARLEGVAQKLAAVRDRVPDASLWEREEKARWAYEQALAVSRSATAELEAAVPHLLRGEVLRAKGAIESHRRRLSELSNQTAQKKALLDKAIVEGHFEELEKAQAEEHEAREALAQVRREAMAARLLYDVVEEAYAESQRLFLAPVSKEAKPYLDKLRPGTDIRMTRDLKVHKIVRRGQEEDFAQLSGGTREQLAVIVRLALARVMARDQRPLPLILDDTMGWTDDARFLSMVQILRDAARELQIILLTCHPSRFERFQAAYSVDLDRLRGRPAPEALAARVAL